MSSGQVLFCYFCIVFYFFLQNKTKTKTLLVEGLEKIRSLKGIELMYGLGNRILGTFPEKKSNKSFVF
jgi:hypothetical protein